MILLALGVRVGPGSIIFQDVFFGSSKCEIGSYSFISVRCLIDGSDWVRLGNRVYLAPNVQLITSSHEFGPRDQRAGHHANGAITVEDGCWLGAGVTVLPGVKIGAGCIVGAASLVRKDTQPNGLYVGSPAKRVRDL